MEGKVVEPANEPQPRLSGSAEERSVALWRFTECRRLGLSHVEARMFAESDGDLGLIRQLVADGCPPSVALRIAL